MRGRRPTLLSYRTTGLGDLLTVVPALRALRAAYPMHEHVLAAPAALGGLVELIGAVDRHVPVEELGRPPRSLGPIDVAVNLHGRGPQSHAALSACAPGRLLAHAHRDVWTAADAPAWDPSVHEVDRWCRLLEAHGIRADPSELSIDPPEDEVIARGWRGATVVHPGAKAPARRWPPDRYAEVARGEVAAGRSVVVTGDAGERDLATLVARLAGLDGAVLAGALSLRALVAVVASAGRVVCGDTGVAHLATALGTPSVVLFGPMDPDRWGPPRERRDRHRVVWHGRTGDPLGTRPDPGLLRISVDEVRTELARLEVCVP